MIPKDENKIKEMVQILSQLHQYVPQVQYEVQQYLPEINETVVVHKAKTHTVMLGGDQLSVARTRSAHKVKATPAKRLDGFIPTVEDWHTKLTMFEVCNLISNAYNTWYMAVADLAQLF